MVIARVNDYLLVDLGIRDVVNESPADSTAATGVDEAILRAGIEGIFAIDKFR